MERVRQRKRDIVDSFRNGSQARVEKTANLELIFGEASFTGPKSVLVRFPTMTFASSERTSSRREMPLSTGGLCPTRSTSTRNSAALA
jgi:pyruvate/2-oxoglutarate dehydrogenase complex dihydrolipoamide dehydrogenase (E3) component